jgi:DNA-binding ferritin-like protein
MGALEEHAPVEPEDEDVYDIRTSLENDLEVYGDIIESQRDHIELATNLGDHATAEILREILVQTEEDAHHIDHYLEDDTLVLSEATR